ncbi:hypothetical protein [Streptomyces thioluteus]
MARGLRGRILDEYLADYEKRCGTPSEQIEAEARQILDEALAEDTS